MTEFRKVTTVMSNTWALGYSFVKEAIKLDHGKGV